MRTVDITKPDRYLTPKTKIFRKGIKDIIVCDFDKVFNIERKNLNMFNIVRPAFYGNATLICNHINIFMQYYDEDKEFITCYLNMKAMIDLSNLTYSYQSFMDDLVNRLFCASIVEKIEKLVEEQYRIDLESKSDEKEKYKDNPQQFTNKHGKILMAISTAIKMCIPIVSHYFYVRKDEVRGMALKSYLYKCFYSLFALFEHGEVSIYNKIHATVDNTVDGSVYLDKGMWNRNKIKGITPVVAKARITKMVIQDLMYKYTFNAIMINLNYAGIRKNVKHLVEGKDPVDYVSISTKRSNAKMSGLEQLEMNAAKVDERDLIISSQGSKSRVKRLSAKYNVEIRKEDIDFYKKHLKLSKFQTNLILQFFAEDFKGTENMKSIGREDFYKMLIIMKKTLERKGFILLQHLMSGNISNKVRARKVGNKKLNKIKTSPLYIQLMKQYSDAGDVVKDELILEPIASFINIPMTYVEHERPELLDVDIEITEDIVQDECMRMSLMI